MKTDFKKFRRLRIAGIVLVAIAFAGFALSMVLIGGAMGASDLLRKHPSTDGYPKNEKITKRLKI